MYKFVKFVLTEDQMPAFGEKLAKCCRNGSVIYLDGTLGMGKTTLSRCIIQGLGWQGRVKSPTYNLVEQYELADTEALHFDLYRLSDAEELEFLGIRDYDAERSLWLVEWPEKGAGLLPPADLLLSITDAKAGLARNITLEAKSPKGELQLSQLAEEDA